MINKFDESAFTYDCKPMHVERAKAVANAIKNCVSLNKDWVVADFGCGTGLLGLQFVGDVYCIEMLDVSEKMLQVLREKIERSEVKNIVPLRFDIFSDEISSEKYNLIMTLMTFHHILDIEKVMERLTVMLKKNGYLAIADLDKEDGSYHQDGNTVHNGIDQNYLKELANTVGLKLICEAIPYIIKKSVQGIRREYPVFLHVYRKN